MSICVVPFRTDADLAFDEGARNGPRARRYVVELDQWSWTCIRSAMASTQARKGPRIFSETNGASGTASRRIARQEYLPVSCHRRPVTLALVGVGVRLDVLRQSTPFGTLTTVVLTAGGDPFSEAPRGSPP